MNTQATRRQGFSLIESLLAMALFLLILLASLEFFAATRTAFFKLQSAQTNQESAMAALEKMKTDAFQSGQGLLEPIGFGLVQGIDWTDGTLALMSLAKTSALLTNAQVGQTTINLDDGEDFGPGKAACIFDINKGELLSVASADEHGLTLTAPLAFNYIKGESAVILIQKVSYFLDAANSTLRRKVNAGAAQPLLEGVRSFVAGYGKDSHLLDIGIGLQSEPDKTRRLVAFLKNMALAERH
ncbi:MAG: prepilin-type N-terminal cleavage/methylation domain-containing protein [Candidatus Aminicenantales bacterium]